MHLLCTYPPSSEQYKVNRQNIAIEFHNFGWVQGRTGQKTMADKSHQPALMPMVEHVMVFSPLLSFVFLSASNWAIHEDWFSRKKSSKVSAIVRVEVT